MKMKRKLAAVLAALTLLLGTMTACGTNNSASSGNASSGNAWYYASDGNASDGDAWYYASDGDAEYYVDAGDDTAD